MKKIIFILLFIVCTIAGFYFFNNDQNQPNPETAAVSFSHFVHTTQHKIKCKNCHRGIYKQARAIIPNIETCSLCHSKIINPKSVREKQVYNYVKNNKQIPWTNYYVVPDFVYFSHRRHVKIGKLDCVLCHGDMTKQKSPLLKNVKPFVMSRCFNCHLERHVTTDCSNCHH